MTDLREVRVAVLDVWDAMVLSVDSALSISQLKSRALEAARLATDASGYLVKFRGAELRDEALSIAAAGVPTGGAVIVMPRRRRAVR